MRNYLKLGSWNAICDICGFRFKADQLKKNWKGEMVCHKDYELRHPQDFLRAFPDKPAPPWSRPQGTDTFINVCYIWGSSAYADLGEADCLAADYQPFSYEQLVEFKGS